VLTPNPPRRLSTRPSHPDFAVEYAYVCVRFNGLIRTDVDSYDADAGIVHVRTRVGRKWLADNAEGWYKTTKLEGVVEPYWRAGPHAPKPEGATSAETEAAIVQAAADKQARKNAKRAALAARKP
jgi:hypothetical protein